MHTLRNIRLAPGDCRETRHLRSLRRIQLLMGKALIRTFEAVSGRRAKSRKFRCDDVELETSKASHAPYEYDADLGLDTSRPVSLAGLDVEFRTGVLGTNYQRTRPTVLRNILGGLSIEWANYSFIDVGCGKGLPLFVASEFPFKNVLGIEFSAELCAIAQANIEHLRRTLNRGFNISVLCADAVKADIPAGPLVIYLFNPFKGPILRKFLRNIQASYQRSKRDILFLYLFPMYSDVFRDFTIFDCVKESSHYSIFRTSS